MSLAVGPELKFACPSVMESSSAGGPSGPNPLTITSVAKSTGESALRRSNSASVARRHCSNLPSFSSSLWPNIGDMQPPNYPRADCAERARADRANKLYGIREDHGGY